MAVVTYDSEFFAEEGRVARESAAIVVPWLIKQRFGWVNSSVIDIGSGTGEWAAEFVAQDDERWEALAIDAYAPIYKVPHLRLDITNGVDCEGWDLAICLEVAEHLPEESAEPLVAGLANAGTVLWSAATPGQPGVGHINCREHEYWHGLFAQHGMTPEFIGGQFDEPVASFYRRNMFLYRRTA